MIQHPAPVTRRHSAEEYGYALSRREWSDDGTRTGLAIATTAPWSNDPSHSARLAEAHWTHTVWTSVLFSDAIRNRHAGWRSQFPIAGPFRDRLVAANAEAASLIEYVRREAWRLSGRDERAGLGRFLEEPAPSIREKRPAAPESAPGRQAPKQAGSMDLHIAQAVRFALETFGPLPSKRLRARQRRALLRKLSATAIKILKQGAWRDMTIDRAWGSSGSRDVER